MNLKTASSPDWKAIGEREYARLAKIYPMATLRNILRVVKGNILAQSLDAAARDEAAHITATLLAEFTPGPALFILRAADAAAGHAERSAKHTGKHLTTDGHR